MLLDPNLAKCGFQLEPQNEEAVMSESGIFLVSIPRLSMQTGPGGSVKPVHRHKKKHRTQLTCLGSKTDEIRVHFRFCYRKTGCGINKSPFSYQIKPV